MSKLIVSRDLELTGFVLDKTRFRIRYESVKARTRHSCEHSKCEKSGFVNEWDDYNNPIPLYPRIEKGDVYFKITLSDFSEGSKKWYFSNEGSFCCEECLEVGLLKLKDKLIEMESDRSGINQEVGNKLKTLHEEYKQIDEFKKSQAIQKEIINFYEMEKDRLKNLKEETKIK